MRKALEFVCLLVGGLAALASVGLLFFARYAQVLLIAGIVLLVLGFVVFSLARPGRSWPARIVLAVLMLGMVGLCQTAPHWLPYVSAADDGSSPAPAVEAPAAHHDRPVVQVADGQTGEPKTDGQAGAGEKPRDPEKEQTLTLDELMKDHIEPAFKAISAKQEYVCTFSKREWCKGLIGGLRLTDEVCSMKIRHEPFSAYLYFEQPKNKQGTEALFVEGKNGGNVIAHSVGFRKVLTGILRVPPTDSKIMADNRYPITTIGMKNLLQKIKNNTKEHKDKMKEFAFTLVDDRKIDGRPCKCIEFFNPKPIDDFPMTSARIYIDREWNVPTGFESYERRDGRSQLVEYYRYTNLKFDPGLKDIDFDPSNPKYDYR